MKRIMMAITVVLTAVFMTACPQPADEVAPTPVAEPAEPAIEAPTTVEPTIEDPMIVDPAVDEPVVEQRAVEGPAIGYPAPDFTLPNLDGEEVTLSDFRGQYVVLEWINYDCPFVVKHYSTGNMQRLQNKYMEQGVAWLGICSSAPGKQGYFEPEKWKELAAERESTPTAILLDPEGNVGRAYRARTTPEMFVINPEGVLLYMGAIDDNPSRRHEDVETAKNYVEAALDAAMAGEEIETTVSRPYGCSVKY